MKRRTLTAKEMRHRAMRRAYLWAHDRQIDGDPEGADSMRDLARAIGRIRLTEEVI